MSGRKYLVVCGCGGTARPLAWLDDDRPIGGILGVDAPVGQVLVIAPELAGGPEPSDTPDEITAKFTEHTVTRTEWNRWGDQRTTWAIRCDGCDRQAQMSRTTYAQIADELAAAEGLAAVEVPVLHDRSGAAEARLLIPFDVLIRRLSVSDG